MRRIDYDTEQYQNYARALTEQQLQAWASNADGVNRSTHIKEGEGS